MAIPVNQNGQILLAGQSVSSSFSGFTVCAFSGSLSNVLTANFTGLKGGDGGSLISGSVTSFLPGTYIPLTIISASLDANSVPVIFYK